MMQVDLGSFSFNTGVSDANGTVWYVKEVDGWDSPPVRQSSIERGAAHGAFLGESLYGPRPIIIKGYAKVTTENGYYYARDDLNEAAQLIEYDATLKVYESIGTKQLDVVRAGPVRMSDGVGGFAFEIQLMALNPVKYSTTLDTDSAAWPKTVANGGTFLTYPVITLVSGYSATTAVFTNTSVAGSPYVSLTNMNNGDVIDFGARTVVTSGGVSKYSSVTLSATTWWFLQPGNNSLTKSGGTNATIEWRDAYI